MKKWFIMNQENESYRQDLYMSVGLDPTYVCRYDQRLKTKSETSTLLTYTGLCGGLTHLWVETRLIKERFASVMGECVI